MRPKLYTASDTVHVAEHWDAMSIGSGVVNLLDELVSKACTTLNFTCRMCNV